MTEGLSLKKKGAASNSPLRVSQEVPLAQTTSCPCTLQHTQWQLSPPYHQCADDAETPTPPCIPLHMKRHTGDSTQAILLVRAHSHDVQVERCSLPGAKSVCPTGTTCLADMSNAGPSPPVREQGTHVAHSLVRMCARSS